ncbi:DUF4333 domain-containing protein [Salinifilum ghardaiensis]
MSSPYGPPPGQPVWQGGPTSWPPQQPQPQQAPPFPQPAGQSQQAPPGTAPQNESAPRAQPQQHPQQHPASGQQPVQQPGSGPQPAQQQPPQPAPQPPPGQHPQQPQWGAQWQPPQHRPVPAAPPGEDPGPGASAGPGGAPAGPGPEGPRRGRARLPWLLSGGAAAVVLAVVAVLGFVAPGWFVRPVFDAAGVQKGIAQTLRDSYRIGDVEQVRCPSGQRVAAGHQFDCRVRIGGETQVVTISVKNDRGVYEVGHPK